MSDTIADMLTRLRNAVSAKHKTVDVKNSRICQGIAKVLKEEGYITDFSVLDDGTKQGLIRITIKYTPTGDQVLRELKRSPDELVAEHPALRDIDVTGGKTVPCAWW